MNQTLQELFEITSAIQAFLDKTKDQNILKPLEEIEKSALAIHGSWSGSWIGYHSNVYYKDLGVPPVQARFSSEWGFLYHGQYCVGEWELIDPQIVTAKILRDAQNPDLSRAEKLAEEGENLFYTKKDEVRSIMEFVLQNYRDSFLKEIVEALKNLTVYTELDFISSKQPSGYMTRDSEALHQGVITPPHIKLLAKVAAIKSPWNSVEALLVLIQKVTSHLKRTKNFPLNVNIAGDHVFIGHGHSHVWRTLKDFVKDTLGLEYEEFNRVPVAGVSTTDRLKQMLDNAAFAFLIMTAEDDNLDGSVRARLNVIHEAGLFQGRLGFNKAIILLEEGCSDFSNIHGLGYIPFPKGNISASFEKIREVLKREGIL